MVFGMMGFAVDLGRLYLIRGELNQAASAMAISAASKLIGTSASLDQANTAARLSLDNSLGDGNKYNFGSLVIGETTGLLSSAAADPSYFTTVSTAIGGDTGNGGGDADGTTARYAQANINADAPLLFWALLSLGQSRKTSIAARAVAGISAPVCTACGIEPFAIAPLNADDATDFGFTVGTRYTLGYSCSGAPVPAVLPGTSQRVAYVILDRYDSGNGLDESQQLYKSGASGILSSTTLAQGCFTINNQELVWATAAPRACSTNSVPASVSYALCGVYSRFDVTPPAICQGVSGIDTLSSAYNPDTDLTDLDDYTAYTGNERRIIAVPIVDSVTSTPLTVLGFRQFLVEATQGQAANDPSDTDGRFQALYIGSVAPLKQGRFDGGCSLSAGPGKVVLHQ